MSLKFTRAVAKAQGLTAKANHVLRVLADRADKEGRCFPSQLQLATDTGLSPRSVWAALKELEASGWIGRERKHRANGERGVDHIIVRDLAGAAKHAKLGGEQLLLPLVRTIEGGKARGGKRVEKAAAYSQDLRVGLLATFARQEPITLTEDSNRPPLGEVAIPARGATARTPMAAAAPPEREETAQQMAARLRAYADGRSKKRSA